MSRVARLLVPLALVCALGAGSSSRAAASPPRPVDLRVVDPGGDAWHADPQFALKWATPAGGEVPSASGYRVRDPQGVPIGENRLPWFGEGFVRLTVPRTPGVYIAEVWFEGPGGARGDAAMALLRFDDTRPASIEPAAIAGWIGRPSLPLRIRLGQPLGPLPPSGLRGYAISLGRHPHASPCAAADRCSDVETTPSSDDTVTVATLPEGISYLNAVAVSGAGMRSATSGRIELRVDLTDPVTRLTGSPAGWTSRPVELSASASDGGAGMAVLGAGPTPFTAIRVDSGAPQIGLGASASATVAVEGEHLVAYYARDAAGNVNDGSRNNGVVSHPPQLAWVRIDRTPPVLAFAPSQDPRDPELLRVRVTDALSGADVGRGWIGVRQTGSGDRFAPLPEAGSAEGELRARWDSDAYPPGEYEFQATGYDAAGNATVTRRRRNGAPLVLSNPLKASTSIAAAFAGGAPARIVRYGRGARILGRLIGGVRSPLGGMAVRIVERFAGAGRSMRTTIVRTGPNGAYSARLAPGPSREVTVAFPGSATLSRSASAPLQLAVRSGVRLRASARVARVGGAPLVLRGKVFPPEAIPAEGKPVELQFRLAGLPWSEFRTVHTDRRGRFRYAYRFSDDDSRGARFQFRAFVPEHEDWPYEPGGSRPVVVLGA